MFICAASQCVVEVVSWDKHKNCMNQEISSKDIDISVYTGILTDVKEKGLKRHSYRPTEKSVDKDISTGVQS